MISSTIERDAGRSEPAVVEVGDGGADLADGVVEVADDTFQTVGELRYRRRGGHALHGESGGEQSLDDMVVKVPGDLGAVPQQDQALLVGPGVGQFTSEGGVDGEGLSQFEVGPGEGAPPDPAADDQSALRPVAAGQRHGHHRSDLGHLTEVDLEAMLLMDGFHADSPAGVHRQPNHAVLRRVGHSPQTVGRRTGRDGDLEHVRVRRRDDQGADVGAGQLAHPFDDDLLRVGTGVTGQQDAADLRRRLQPALPALGLLVQPGVFDGKTSGGGEGGEQFLVLVGEIPASRCAR